MTKTVQNDPPTQFLLFCLQGRFNPAALEMARGVTAQDDFDWKSVADLIAFENLAPLLHSIIHGHSLFPSELEQELRESYLRTAIRNALLFNELAQLVEKFAGEGVNLIVLKGAALAETLYKNIAIRPMVDLDILVQSDDVDTTLALLKSVGYYAVDPETHPGSLTEFENELLLKKPGTVDVALELHWSLVDSPHYQRKIDMVWFWQSAVFANLNRVPGRILGAEALLLHLCSHIMLHHKGEGMLWLHDVAEVLNEYGSSINWETVLNKAQSYDLVLSLQRILTRVSHQWNIELPPGILERINELQPSPRELKVFHWLTAEERPVAQRFWVDLATSVNWRRRLEYALQNLFPSPAYMRQRYEIKQSLLLPFYYPYRWLLGLLSAFHR